MEVKGKAGDCPSCGESLPVGIPSEQCPRCLLGIGMLGLNDLPRTAISGGDSDRQEIHREEIGSVIAGYRLLREIGEGGFGIVYLAEQLAPVRRTVALKILKPGMDTREIVARFEAERQALAMMDHPNIALVYDGGTTESGRPFFVMKLVEGEPLTEYCVRHQLTIRQRLEIFLDGLSAVQHAHQKGIIHRDLKPSNILVAKEDGKPVAKVIDFGIAKALSVNLTEKTLVTEFGRMIGTPQYMSPEQAGPNVFDVDTRSDIYSLGVLLYELLTGRTPIDPAGVGQAGYAEIQRLVREEEPVKPSTLIAAQKRAASRGGRNRLRPLPSMEPIPKDLDWVVMKALEKDRSRRYQTTNGLAVDLRRFLRSEPVSASPPSTGYRFAKFARRNRFAVAWTGVLSLVILAAAIGMTLLYFRADKEATRAKDQALSALQSKAAALRSSRKAGRRFEALAALREATALAFVLGVPDLMSLRDEVIACLAIADIQPGFSWKGNPGKGDMVVPNPSFTAYADTLPDGEIVIHEYGDAPRVVRRLSGNGEPVNFVLQFNAGGDCLAAAYGTSRFWDLKLWDLGDDETARSAGQGVDKAFDFFPYGSRCVVGRPDGELVVLDVASGNPIGEPIRLAEIPYALSVNRDGTLLAVGIRRYGGQEGRVVILNLATNRTLEEIRPADPRALAWSPYDDTLAVGCGDAIVRVWPAGERGLSDGIELEGHSGEIDAIAWSPDGRLLASHGEEGTVWLWDPFQGEALSWHPGNASALRFSPDGSRLGILLGGDSLTDLEVSNTDACYRGRGHVGDIGIAEGVWNSKGTLMATTGDDGVRLWNREGRHLEFLELEYARGVAFSEDALFAASAGGLQRWPITTIRDGTTVRFGAPERVDDFHSCEQISLSPTDATLALVAQRSDSAEDARAVWILDLAGTAPPRCLGGPPDAAYCAFSPDGQWLAAGASKTDGVWVWAPRGTTDPVLLGSNGSARVAFTPDGRWLVVGDHTSYRFLETGTWKKGTEIPGGMASSQGAMAFSPSKTIFAVAQRRAELKILHSLDLTVLSAPDFDREIPVCFDPYATIMVTKGERRGVFFWRLDAVRDQLLEWGLDFDIRGLPSLTLPVVRGVEFP